MPVTIKIDYTTSTPTYLVVVPDATEKNDGVMTKQMVTKLNSVAGFKFNVTAVQTADYDAQPYDLVQCDASGGSFNVTLPSAAANPGVVIATKSIPSAGTATFRVQGTGGDTVDGGANFTANGGGFNKVGVVFVSDGVSNWIVLADYQNNAS